MSVEKMNNQNSSMMTNRNKKFKLLEIRKDINNDYSIEANSIMKLA